MSGTGNRCGHDRRRPRLELSERPDPRKPFPWIIALLLERLAWLYNDRRLFPELGPRKRSERIEAMVLVGRAIARTCDRLTLRSGIYQGRELVAGITMQTIARWALISRQRAFRAVWDLRDAGFVSLAQPIEQRKDGSRRGKAGIRCLRPTLFERLKLGGRLKRERKELYEERRKENREAKAETIAERRRLRRLFGASRRAAALAKRAAYQLADRTTPTEPRVFTPAELEARMAEWRDRNRD